MEIIGLIAEYNPLHNGHLYHIKKIKEKYPMKRETVKEFKQKYTDRYKQYKDEMIKDYWRQ